MHNKSIRKILLITAVLILICSAIFFIPYEKHFVFIDSETSEIAVRIPVIEDRFKIRYTHSIHLSEVFESYRLSRDGQLVLTELEYEDFNIGMPSNAGEGERFVEKDGKYFIKDMKRELPEFRLLIGDVDAELVFLFAGKELDLKKSLERGKIYTFRAQRLSIYQQLEGVNIYE
ncbi:DUF1850 domain-containing protein [Planococcus sp. ISL-109]|uniref:DUF1850 domain-containing protein n=1 Tax=Planococcus sp. ISL-109 TaxID=2819166 RepID=UPI001BE9EC39|nr:DUF1850 domain-containing protein [Planococcus sp. ISL-109]MBT2581753.1 DUF1850 domain-containing protein [Planococcus sp. ISL-109]